MSQTYGCEYCNERVEVEERDGMWYCSQCGSALGPADSATRLMMS